MFSLDSEPSIIRDTFFPFNDRAPKQDNDHEFDMINVERNETPTRNTARQVQVSVVSPTSIVSKIILAPSVRNSSEEEEGEEEFDDSQSLHSNLTSIYSEGSILNAEMIKTTKGAKQSAATSKNKRK